MNQTTTLLRSVLLTLTLCMSGCSSMGWIARASDPKAVSAPNMMSKTQRFVPVTTQNLPGMPWVGSFALDTQTGQLCKTHSIDNTNAAWAVSLPLCIDLYSDT